MCARLPAWQSVSEICDCWLVPGSHCYARYGLKPCGPRIELEKSANVFDKTVGNVYFVLPVIGADVLKKTFVVGNSHP